MNLFLLYLWLKLDTISNLIWMIGFLLMIFGTVWYGIWRIIYGNVKPMPVLRDSRGDIPWDLRRWIATENACRRFAQRNKLKWYLGWYLGGFLFLFSFVIPSKEDSAYLVAGYMGNQVIASPEMGKVTQLLRAKVNNYLDQQLKDVQSKAVDAAKQAASAVSK